MGDVVLRPSCIHSKRLPSWKLTYMYVYINVSHIPYKGTFEDVFPVEQRWDMLVSWKVAVDFFCVP